MATYTVNGRTYVASDAARVHVSGGKYRALSEADEILLDTILHAKSYSEEIPAQDLDMIEQKYGAKALSTPGTMTTAANGWQPTTLGSQIIDLVRAKSRVRGFHTILNAPSDPYELPVNLDDFQVTLDPGQGQQTPQGSQKVTQNRVRFNHHKLMVETSVSTEFEEDSVPQTLQFLKNLLAQNIADAEENLLFINHSTEGILNKAADKSGSVTTSAFNPANSAARVIELLATMDIPYNLDPSNLVLYIHPTLYWQLIQSGEVATMDKFGPMATVATGELAKFYGMSVAPIASIPQVSGTPVKYPLIIVNRQSVLLSQRRQLTIRVFPLEGDKNKIEATVRSAIAYPFGQKGIVKANYSLT